MAGVAADGGVAVAVAVVVAVAVIFVRRFSKPVVQLQMKKGQLPTLSAEEAQENFRKAIESGTVEQELSFSLNVVAPTHGSEHSAPRHLRECPRGAVRVHQSWPR